MKSEHGAIALLILCIPWWSAVAQNDIYRSQTSDGQRVFSDKPVQGAQRSEKVVLPPVMTMPAPPHVTVSSTPKGGNDPEGAGKKPESRRNAQKAAKDAVDQAEEELEQARQERIDGAAKGPGDRRAGGRKTTESYRDRQEALEESVRQAEEKLDEARRRYNEVR